MAVKVGFAIRTCTESRHRETFSSPEVRRQGRRITGGQPLLSLHRRRYIRRWQMRIGIGQT